MTKEKDGSHENRAYATPADSKASATVRSVVIDDSRSGANRCSDSVVTPLSAYRWMWSLIRSFGPISEVRSMKSWGTAAAGRAAAALIRRGRLEV